MDGGLQYLVDARGPLQIDRAVNYLAQSGPRPSARGRRRALHRDVKPSSLMVNWTGIVKVLDLGLARLLGVDNLTHAASAGRL